MVQVHPIALTVCYWERRLSQRSNELWSQNKSGLDTKWQIGDHWWIVGKKVANETDSWKTPIVINLNHDQ